jgi:hypothetical protein
VTDLIADHEREQAELAGQTEREEDKPS